MVGSPFRKAGRGWEVLSEGREWSRGPAGGPGVVGSSCRRAGISWDALPKCREWSGDPTQGPGVVMRPFWEARSGRQLLPEGWD